MITDTFQLACSTCANNFFNSDNDAAGWAIAVMLLVIVPLVGGILALFIRMARRERTALDPEYCDDYVPPSS